jgi:hypothetical protein
LIERGGILMKIGAIDKLLFYLTVSFMALLSFTFLFMPYASEEADKPDKLGLYLTGGAFWIFMILGYGFALIMGFRRRKIIKKYGYDKISSFRRLGILRFFSNKTAGFCDVIFLISLVCFLICQFISYKNEMVIYLLLSVTICFFHMHCMFNGRNYKYIRE